MDNNTLLSEEEVLRIIQEDFATEPVEDFELIIPRASNGGGAC